jgi:hypothetical protein
MHPALNREKFDREVGRINEQRLDLQSRGIFVLGTNYPIVELLFVPRHPLQLPVAKAQVSIIILPVPTVTYEGMPMLSARAFKARFDLTDYDLRAPSLEFRDPWTDTELKYSEMSLAHQFDEQSGCRLVLLEHPTTHRPFLCLRGTREYHEHPQHSGDDWLLYRQGFGLFSLVMSLWRVGIDLIHPRLNFSASNVSVQWIAEEKR